MQTFDTTPVWENPLCEVLTLPTGDYRLYCEGISEAREQNIIDNVGMDFKLQSKTGGAYDGALILDFDPMDLDFVKQYFK